MKVRKTFFLSLLLISLVLGLCLINIKVLPVYAITTYLTDNFESFNTLNNWQNTGTNPFQKTTEQKHGGSYSVVVNTTGTQYGYLLNITQNIQTSYHVSCWIYLPSTITFTGLYIYEGYNTTSSVTTVSSNIYSNATGYYIANKNSAGTDINIFSISSDTWHNVEMFINTTSSGSVRYYLDNIFEGQFVVTNNKGVNYIYIGDVGGSAGITNGKMFYDDLLIDNNDENTLHGLPLYDLTKTGTNSTLSVSNILFYSYWYVATNTPVLSGFIFSCNSSGSFVNDTYQSFTSNNNTFANITKSISNNVGNTVSWQVIANNSVGTTTLPLQSFIVTAQITFYFNSNGILEKNGTSISNSSSVTYNTISPVIHLSGVPTTNYAFMNFSISGTTITSNPYNFTVQNTTSVWCYFDLSTETPPASKDQIIMRFEWSPNNAYINQQIKFDGTSSFNVSTVTSYKWNFGDGNETDGLSYSTIYHTYTSIGSYNVTLDFSTNSTNYLGSSFAFHLINITVNLYSEGWTDGNNSGYSSGWIVGNSTGYSTGYSAGFIDGNYSGWISGNNTGWISGNNTGYSNGYAVGWSIGNSTGYSTGYSVGYSKGYADGLLAGGGTTDDTWYYGLGLVLLAIGLIIGLLLGKS